MPTSATHILPTAPRTIRNIVEDAPQLVDEPWCRNVLAQLLCMIETDRADDLTHRIIMPDTVTVDQSGVAALLPSVDEALEFKPAIVVDLKALAAVVHFAITREIPPRGPLASRALPGYSAALLEAIDRCLHGDRNARPQTVGALRSLLGIEAPPPAGQTPPASPGGAPLASSVPAEPPPRGSSRVWMTAAGVCVLVAAGFGVYELGRRAGVEEQRVAQLQAQSQAAQQAAMQTPSAPAALTPADSPALAPAPAPASAPASDIASDTAPDRAADPAHTAGAGNVGNAASDADPRPSAPAPGASGIKGAGPAPASVAPRASAPGAPSAAASPATTAAPLAVNESPAPGTIYKLQVKPWGNVFVDGARRGVTPPLKALKLNAGEHTVRIENPSYPIRVIVVKAGKTRRGVIEHNFQ